MYKFLYCGCVFASTWNPARMSGSASSCVLGFWQVAFHIRKVVPKTSNDWFLYWGCLLFPPRGKVQLFLCFIVFLSQWAQFSVQFNEGTFLSRNFFQFPALYEHNTYLLSLYGHYIWRIQITGSTSSFSPVSKQQLIH